MSYGRVDFQALQGDSEKYILRGNSLGGWELSTSLKPTEDRAALRDIIESDN